MVFTRIEQIKEVYGITEETFNLIQSQLTLPSHPIKKLQINLLNASELAQHPYINKKQAHLIVSYRSQHGLYKDMVNLSENRGLIQIFCVKLNHT